MASTNHGKDSPFMAEFRSLLVSSPVQKIQFRFGAFQLLPIDFRQLATKLSSDDSFVTCKIDAEYLKSIGALASYENTYNKFTFRDELVFRDPVGRGEAVHEAVHAIYDLRDKVRMNLSSEAVCFLAGAMYHVVSGTEQSFLAQHSEQRFIDIASNVYARGKHRIPEVTLSERLELRKILRKHYKYKRGLTLATDGFDYPS